jgi:hypothetical protein
MESEAVHKFQTAKCNYQPCCGSSELQVAAAVQNHAGIMHLNRQHFEISTPA